MVWIYIKSTNTNIDTLFTIFAFGLYCGEMHWLRRWSLHWEFIEGWGAERVIEDILRVTVCLGQSMTMICSIIRKSHYKYRILVLIPFWCVVWEWEILIRVMVISSLLFVSGEYYIFYVQFFHSPDMIYLKCYLLFRRIRIYQIICKLCSSISTNTIIRILWHFIFKGGSTFSEEWGGTHLLIFLEITPAVNISMCVNHRFIIFTYIMYYNLVLTYRYTKFQYVRSPFCGL